MQDWKVDVPEGTSGNVEVRKFTVPERSIENLRLSLQGRGVIPGDYTMILRDNEIWMSDTTAEATDHLDAYLEMQERGGRVLVVGLGLGMIVRKALELPNVEHVDVVEIDPDVIALVGPTYEGERCTIHQGDIYSMKWPPNTHWSVAWFDIWPSICEDNLPEMTTLARKYGRRVDWQGFWARERCLQMKHEFEELTKRLRYWLETDGRCA